MIVIVAGVSGSGKSTVGQVLADRLGWVFADGDSMHPPSNIAAMAAGIPLTDAERLPWLRAIAGWMDRQIVAGQSAVVACSALKRSYRRLLLDGRPAARIAFLLIDHDLAAARLAARHGHFFDPALLDSQFADLEPPGPDETSVLPVRVPPAAPGPTPSGPAPSGPAPSGPAPSGPAPSGPAPSGPGHVDPEPHSAGPPSAGPAAPGPPAPRPPAAGSAVIGPAATVAEIIARLSLT
jgi:gluconokinase